MNEKMTRNRAISTFAILSHRSSRGFYQFPMRFYIFYYDIALKQNCIVWSYRQPQTNIYLIETMKIAFARLLLNDPWFLQQVVGDDTANWIALVVKLDVHIFAEAAGIIVAICFRIAKCLQNRIALDQYIFDAFDFVLATGICDRRYVFHDDFRCFRFASTTFTGYHNACVAISLFQGAIGGIRYGKHVRCILEEFSACKIGYWLMVDV